ncbi:hypothetical protein pqer_cds_369 [Pandoravirus quercus]|uniref:Uncharacterized protein n=1 Tax=Pandoravirus quercus TaxID=2107709 RepID=A0A2U7U8M5_9VIRU|nr:hypothetical protein pqer_cds_369 [Pandoravirus quercus]AVK74791.1 hypothetical protein pqer_cds_369 [Pandoravirus quercus]
MESPVQMKPAFAVPPQRTATTKPEPKTTTKMKTTRTMRHPTAKRSLSEGDLAKATAAPRKRRRAPALGVVLVCTSDGTTFSLDVSPGGRFGARFPHSHLILSDDAIADDHAGNVNGDTHADTDDAVQRRLNLADVDRVAFAPVYAYVAFDGADFGPRGTIEINGLVASALTMCVDRLDAVDAAAAALGVPEVGVMLRAWVKAAMPCPADTGNRLRIAAAEGAIEVSCVWRPRDRGLVERALGVQGAEQFCADMFQHQLGTTQSRLAVRIPLPRFDQPLEVPPLATADAGDAVDDPEWLAPDAPLRGWLPFLAATSRLDKVPGAYERARSASVAHEDDDVLQRPLDDLRLLAYEMPSRVCIDNPYHIAATFFCCLYGVNARCAVRALKAVVNGDMGLVGLLMDANARYGSRMPPPRGGHVNGPRIEMLLTDYYLGGLGLTGSDLYVVDNAITLYYRDHDRFRQRFPPLKQV